MEQQQGEQLERLLNRQHREQRRLGVRQRARCTLATCGSWA
jgi:hypothetical protein